VCVFVSLRRITEYGGIFHVNQKKIYKKKELNGKHDIPILVVEREKIEHKNINKVSKREIFVETKEEILLKKKREKKNLL